MAAGLAVIAFAATTHAVDRSWLNAAGGNFSDMMNWSGNMIPGSNDRQLYNLNATYTVTLSQAVFTGGLSAQRGVVMLNLNGFSMSQSFNQSTIVGQFNNESARVDIFGGSNYNAWQTTIGANANNGDGVLNLIGPGTQFLGSAAVTVGNGADGEFTIKDGAFARAFVMTLGGSNTGTGLLTVAGPGSRLLLREGTIGPFRDLTAGFAGASELVIELSGEVECAAGIMGSLAGVNSLAEVRSGGSWIMHSGLTVGALGNGTLNVTDDGDVECVGTLRIADQGGSSTVTVSDAGSTLRVLNGIGATNLVVGFSGRASLNVERGGVVEAGTTVGGVLASAAGSQGEATVIGAGSMWTMGQDLLVGNQARATLRVLDGGFVECRGAFIGPGSSVEVGDANSLLEATTSYLTVGSGGVAELLVRDGGRCMAPDIPVNPGSLVFGGGGTLEGDVENAGEIQPGRPTATPSTSFGELSIIGPYTQTALGRLSIELNGLGIGLPNDLLDVSGAANLGGEVAVSIVGAEPALGATFEILTAASVSGVFATETLPTLSGSKFLDVVYEPARVLLVVGSNCTGDLNGDGDVNAADLGALLGSWGNAGGPADLNGDGVVNAADLGILLGSWGACP
ncbi:MAG: dockerin type I domain-containing protein [Planctomycetota bacterium]|nr:dockerin type I domain-containing protein [Planctomycetota bacterium]